MNSTEKKVVVVVGVAATLAVLFAVWLIFRLARLVFEVIGVLSRSVLALGVAGIGLWYVLHATGVL